MKIVHSRAATSFDQWHKCSNAKDIWVVQDQLVAAKFSPDDLKKAGFSLQDLVNAG